ncbi:MAG: peptidase [Chloroflexi bacterium]|nr:MAG: peptidase [Chloroflexota bacterium]
MKQRIIWIGAVALLWVVGLAGGLPAARAQSQTLCTAQAIVQPGDTLSTVATRYFGQPSSYTAIVTATNAAAAMDSSYATIADPDILAVGWKLCIPATSAAGPALVATPTPTATPTPAGTPTPTPTPLPADRHPLAIPQMRRASYPGSDLVVEQTLDPGVNYSRTIVSYRSEGNKIYALLTAPLGEKPATGWPVVIFNHGYIPPDQYRTTERYVAYVDAFARNGYLVLRSDYRGHGFSEGEATGGYGSPDYTVDVLNAVSAIKRYPDADPNRIGMWGHSMGGQITLRAMVVTGDIKAGVIWAGVVGSYPDLLENWRRRPSTIPPTVTSRQRRWREELTSQYGSPAENPEFWAMISPNSYLADLSGPIQLHHGTADSSVPVEFSTTLESEIETAGGTVELFLYEGDDHNIAANLGTALTRSVAFFDRYVKNAPSTP